MSDTDKILHLVTSFHNPRRRVLNITVNKSFLSVRVNLNDHNFFITMGNLNPGLFKF